MYCAICYFERKERDIFKCEAREDYYRRMHGIQRKFEQQGAEFKAVKKEKAALKQSLSSQTAANPPQL